MRRVLCILQIPPPKHGASFVGKVIMNSKKINTSVDCDYIRISTVPMNGSRGFIPKIKVYVQLLKKIRERLLTKQYDLIYITPCATGFAFYKDFIICSYVKRFHKNIVYHFHNKGISKNRKVPPGIKKYFFRNAKVILLSPLLYFDIMKYVKEEVVYYCPNGITLDAELFKKEGGKEKTDISILFLSNMIRTKGVFVLLHACKLLQEQGFQFICKFVGPWYDIKEKYFYSMVKEYNLENRVKYLGPKYGRDKYEELINTDIFTFPTFYPDECFPLVILEAMSCQLPIIASDEGAIPEIIENGKQGFIIPKKDPEALAAALAKLIENKDMRDQMSRAGYEKYKGKYTVDIFENRFIEILNSI